jgi:hypothetical protein
MDRSDAPDIMEATLANEPMLPMDSIEPTEPMDSIDPLDLIDRIEFSEPMDRIDVPLARMPQVCADATTASVMILPSRTE